MRKQGSTIAQRVVAVAVSAVMALSLLVAGPRDAHAGLISNMVECKWRTIAGGAMERVVVWGIGKAASSTDNEDMAEALTMAKRIISGNSSIVASQTLEEVKHVSAQLSELYTYTVNSTNEIEDMIQKLGSEEAWAEFDDNAGSQVDDFSVVYNEMVQNFNSLLDALVAYGEDPGEQARTDLELCYNKVYNTYYKDPSKTVSSLFTEPLVGRVDLTGFLPLISPYDPSQPIDEGGVTDSASWKPRGVELRTTYLGRYFDYVTTVVSFQNNVYDSMRSAASVVDNAAYLYLQAYRYYCEFKAMLIACDASLSEGERRGQASYLWNEFYTAAQRLVRGINQMYESQSKVFGSYMRTYDVRATKRIKDYASRTNYCGLLRQYEKDNEYNSIANLDINTIEDVYVDIDIVSEYQHVYQFRLANDSNTTYAIRSSTNGTSEDEDISRAFFVSEIPVKMPGTEDYNDTLSDCIHINPNLIMLLRELEDGFKVPVHMRELDALVTGSYQSEYGLVDNIRSELQKGLGEDDVHLPAVCHAEPSIDFDALAAGPNFLVLRSDFYEDCGGFVSSDAKGSMGNISMPYDGGHEAYFDYDDKIYEKSGSFADKETVTMWIAENPEYELSLETNEGGEATIEWGDHSISVGKGGHIESGTPLTVRVRPYAGCTIDSVALVDGKGDVLDYLLDDAVLSDDETIDTQELLDCLGADEDGCYSFSLPMCCRGATVRVSFKPVDQALVAREVRLSDVENDSGGYDAVSQFGSYDYLGAKSFRAGERVVVSVMGYDHHMATGLAVADAGGGEVEVEVSDVSGQMLRTSPSERLYEFAMPDQAQDLYVTPVLEKSNPVEVIKDGASHVTHAFEDLGLLSLGGDTDWSHADQLDYAEGDTVKMSFGTEKGLIIKDVQVVSQSDYSPIPTTMQMGKVVFTMPSCPVAVSVAEEGVDTSKRVLSLDTELEGSGFQFVEEDGSGSSVNQREFSAGDPVRVKATFDDSVVYEHMTLTAVGGEENLFEVQGGAYDPETGMVTFAMPDVNATLSAAPRAKTKEELDGMGVDDEGRILIGTYEELVNFRNALDSDPDYYGASDKYVSVTNNIIAYGKPAWTKGISGAFTGTFDGNGYCIIGLDCKSPANGLFDYNNGTVRHLYLHDCTFDCEGGGIAGQTWGDIEDCVNGANLANAVDVDLNTGELVPLGEYVSSAHTSGDFGGIVGVNSGRVMACRSAAEISSTSSGSHLACIVAYNQYAQVDTCIANGKVSCLSDESSAKIGRGGLVGTSEGKRIDNLTYYSYYGTIYHGYSSAVVESTNRYAGCLVGDNRQSEMAKLFYTNDEGLPAVDYREDDGFRDVAEMSREDMMRDSFTDALNEASDHRWTYIRSDGLNGGLPRIKNATGAFGDVTLESGGVRASGNMHKGARLAASRIPSDSEAGRLLSAAGDGAPGVAYACAIEDADGNRIPAEFWVQSDLTYAVPVSGEDVEVAVMLADGSVRVPDDVDVAHTDSGYEVTFTSDYAVAFMVLGAEPQPEPTPDDGFDRDEDGHILIGTYQDLVKFSQLVRQNPQTYSTADVELAANIKATGEAAWTQGIGSKADDISYNGTFEGNGHCIFGLRFGAAQDAGLFEVIGERGVVRNLFLFDCDSQSPANVGGGIAAYNYGRIEHCVNGVNLTNGVYVSPKTNQTISLRELNSVVDAGVGGGIAGNNLGTIYGCRSAAVLRGDSVGSVAGVNGGTVSNCAGNGSVGSEATESCDCGGLVGSNGASGVVEAGYSSATIDSSVPNRGNIAGTQLGSVIDTYYTNSEEQLPFESSADGSTATNVNGVRRGEMMQDSFLQMLDAVSSNSVTWVRNDSLNMGLPRIKNESAAFGDVTLTVDKFAVRGNMHLDASMAITTLGSDSEAWEALAGGGDDYVPVAAYAYELQDADGNLIPSELWVQSALTYTVPVPSEDVVVRAWTVDGTTKSVDGVKVEEADTGYVATFTADSADAIMVLQEGSGSGTGDSGSGSGASASGNGSTAAAGTTKAGTTTVATRTASTGDDSLPTAVIGVIAAAAVLLIACGLVWRRRRGGRQ